jgi:hypothetical protein
VEEYRFYASAARPTVIAFRVLSAMLLSFTELYAEIYKYNSLAHLASPDSSHSLPCVCVVCVV